MYIRELTTFITVAEQGSFLKASKELYITPASVMNQINKLESRIGVKLIERTNQGTQLTAAGRSICKDAKKIIKQSEQAIARARQIASDEQQAIRVGTSILRPCKTLVDLWSKVDDGTLSVTIHIVPFDDSPSSMETMLDSLGREIDCFVGPCDSLTWKERYNILPLTPVDCCIAVPRKHKLSKKELILWKDLDGETFMLVKRGDSPVLNKMRDEIEMQHPQITLFDTPHFYDTGVFNECEQMGYVMETLDIWKDVHPSIVTIPMEWNYKMPYGIVYAKNHLNLCRHLSKRFKVIWAQKRQSVYKPTGITLHTFYTASKNYTAKVHFSIFLWFCIKLCKIISVAAKIYPHPQSRWGIFSVTKKTCERPKMSTGRISISVFYFLCNFHSK